MTQLITEEMSVPSEPGIDIFVRNKRPADLARFTPERTVLFVHGSTYPAHTGFDIPLGGQSWMDTIASHGYDVYCLDVRGYGRSTRPKAMSEPPQSNPQSCARPMRSRTLRRCSILSSSAATSQSSICSAGRGAAH